jgi:hypothetical protein
MTVGEHDVTNDFIHSLELHAFELDHSERVRYPSSGRLPVALFGGRRLRVFGRHGECLAGDSTPSAAALINT